MAAARASQPVTGSSSGACGECDTDRDGDPKRDSPGRQGEREAERLRERKIAGRRGAEGEECEGEREAEREAERGAEAGDSECE